MNSLLVKHIGYPSPSDPSGTTKAPRFVPVASRAWIRNDLPKRCQASIEEGRAFWLAWFGRHGDVSTTQTSRTSPDVPIRFKRVLQNSSMVPVMEFTVARNQRTSKGQRTQMCGSIHLRKVSKVREASTSPAGKVFHGETDWTEHASSSVLAPIGDGLQPTCHGLHLIASFYVRSVLAT